MTAHEVSRFADLKSPDFLDHKSSGVVYVWPIGATEQHGPHLPIGTDNLILEALRPRILDKLGDSLRTVWLPPLSFGCSGEHVGLAGTLSLSPRTAMSVIEDVCASMVVSGCTNVAFLNGHGGNVGVLTVMLRELRFKYGILTCLVRPFSRLGSASHGGLDLHAGELETSVMMALRPDLVDEAARCAGVPGPLAGEPATALDVRSFGWLTRDLSTNGVIGNPRWASDERGEILVEEMTEFAANELIRFAQIVRLSVEGWAAANSTAAEGKGQIDG